MKDVSTTNPKKACQSSRAKFNLARLQPQCDESSQFPSNTAVFSASASLLMATK